MAKGKRCTCGINNNDVYLASWGSPTPDQRVVRLSLRFVNSLQYKQHDVLSGILCNEAKIMALQNSWPHDPHLEDHVISVDVGQPELAVSATAS